MRDFVIKDGILSDSAIPGGRVVIPEGVTVIGEGAFMHKRDVTAVVIPRSVEIIEDRAFYECTNLQEIYIPGNVKRIGKEAFAECVKAKKLTLCEGVKSIGKQAFSFCCSLEQVTLPDSLRRIGEGAFRECECLQDKDGFVIVGNVLYDYLSERQDVIIPESVTAIDTKAFYGAETIVSVTIPDSVKRIGPYAFSKCDKLKSVHIPGSVKHLGACAFFRCENLRTVTLGEGVKTLGAGAFRSCEKLTKIVLPESLQFIKEDCFAYCTKLRSVMIPAGLQEIGDYAFSHCRRLASISIPETTEVGKDAFEFCGSLADADGFVIVQGWLYGYYGPGGDVVIPPWVKSVSERAFMGHDQITSLTIPPHLKITSRLAFWGCEGLADADGFVIVQGRLFGYYGPGGDVVIPKGVTVIGEDAFRKQNSIDSVYIPEGVTAIEDGAFSHCQWLKSIHIPDSVTSIGDEVFFSCNSLKSVVLPKGLTHIDGDCFKCFSKSDMQYLLAPDLPPKAFKKCGNDKAAAIGYLCDPRAFEKPEIIDAYRQYVKKNIALLTPLLVREDRVAGMETCVREGFLTDKNFENFLQPAMEAGATACIAFLLNWKNKNHPSGSGDFKL